MSWTGDALADFDRYDRKQQEALDELPVCCECDQPIQDDECFEFDGELICPQCLKDNHQKHTEDYIV